MSVKLQRCKKEYREGEPCRTCRYRGSDFAPEKCSYSLITGRCRLCSPINCAKYEEGPRDRVEMETGVALEPEDPNADYWDYRKQRYAKKDNPSYKRRMSI